MSEVVSDSRLTDFEQSVLGRLAQRLHPLARRNRRLWDYFDGKAGVRNMGIAIPESLLNVDAVVGWPETVVDSLAERIEWRGWRSGSADVSGLQQVFADNQLGIEFSKAVLESFVTGVGFLAVSAGDPDQGEPAVVVDAVPSTRATFEWDERLNRVAYGYVEKTGPDGELIETLYTPDETVVRTRADSGESVRRLRHGRGRCGLIALPNRGRAGDFRGRTEITPAIRYLTDHGVRTILGMEYNREIYTTPQRYLLNVAPEQLGLSEEPSEREMLELGWKVAQNKALVVPPPDEGDTPGEKFPSPQAGEFRAASPAPYIDQLRMLSQLVASQSGVPSSYLGFSHDNPPSADSIRASEARLVKKAELRQAMFGQVLVNDLAFVCQSILVGGRADAGFVSSLSPMWVDPSTPTMAATMDAMVKAVQVGVAPSNSSVVWDRLGFSAAEQEVMRRELAQQQAAARFAGLAQGAGQVGDDEVVGLARANRSVP